MANRYGHRTFFAEVEVYDRRSTELVARCPSLAMAILVEDALNAQERAILDERAARLLRPLGPTP